MCALDLIALNFQGALFTRILYLDLEELRWRKREESQEEIESRSDWRKDMLEGVEREKERSDKQVKEWNGG